MKRDITNKKWNESNQTESSVAGKSSYMLVQLFGIEIFEHQRMEIRRKIKDSHSVFIMNHDTITLCRFYPILIVPFSPLLKE